MISALFRFVGLRHLRMRPVRTILTTLGVAFGIALYVAISIINRSTLSSFKQSVDAVAGKATLFVAAGETGFPEDRLQVVEKVPGVTHAAPIIEARGYLVGKSTSKGEAPGTETIEIMGVDLLREQSVRTYETTDQHVIDDPLTFLNQPDSLIVTNSFAKEHGLKIDSKLELATAHGTKSFTVRGMLSPVGPAKAYGGAIAIMDIDGAQMTFAKDGKLDRIDIITSPGADVEQVAQRLRAALGPGYEVARPESQSESMERMVKSFQTMMTFFSTLALLVGIFLVSNSVSIAVAERKKEIGTLRALGATRRGILALFLAEATAMGFLGALLGALLGRLLASLLVGMTSRTMSTQFLTKIDVTHLDFGVRDIAIAAGIGALAAFAAALFPARRAASLHPLEAMRRRELADESKNEGFWSRSLVTGLGLLGYLAISSALGLGSISPALETSNAFAAMVGAALVGPVLVSGLIRLIRPALLAAGGTVLRLSQDNLLRNPRRTGSNVMSLMVGLILVIIIAAVNASFRLTMLDWFHKVVHSDLLVSSQGKLISYQAQPLDEEVGREIEQVPGVKMGPVHGVYGMRFIHVKYEGQTLGLKAVDEPDPTIGYTTVDLKDRDNLPAGRDLWHGDMPTTFVSENFVIHFGKKTGDLITIVTPSGPVKFRIVGVITDFASYEGVFYMSRETYKRFWKDRLVNVFVLDAKPGVDPAQLRQEIDSRLGRKRNLLVLLNREARQQLSDTIDQSFSYTRAIEWAALLVALLGLLNTLLVSVMERTRELGMLRAVGMSRGQVFRMILLEAVTQGGFGAIVAVAMGSWISYLWVTHSLTAVLGWIVHFHFPLSAVAITVITGIAVALVSGIFPSRRAARIEIREALEYD